MSTKSERQEDRRIAAMEEKAEQKREDKAESKRLEALKPIELAEEIKAMLLKIQYQGISHRYEQMRDQVVKPAIEKLDKLITMMK